MEPIEYLRALRRRWWIVAAAVAVAAAAGFVTAPPPESVPEQRTYSATHTLYDDPLDDGGALDVGLDTVAMLTTTGEIPRRVVEELGLDVEPAVLASEMDVNPNPGLGTLEISTTQEDPERAELLANTFATQVQEFFDSRQLQRDDDRQARLIEQQLELEEEIEALRDERDELAEGSVDRDLVEAEIEALVRQYGIATEQLTELRREGGPGSAGLVSLEQATAIPQIEGGFTVPTNRDTRSLIGGGIGALLGVALALFTEQIDTKLRTRRDAEQALRLPVLAEVPRVRGKARQGVITHRQPASFAAESYRILRLGLQMAPRWSHAGNGATARDGDAVLPAGHPESLPARTGEVHVVLVTSAAPGEGKSTTVANLAASYAELGQRALVVDCDFRNPRQHNLLDAPRSPGVTEYLTRGTRRPALSTLVQPTAIPGVSVVTNGAAVDNPGELLGPDQDLVSEARRLADVVIIDTGPLLAVNDPAALMPQVDAALLVTRSGETTTDMASRTAELLRRMGAPVAGAALIAVPRGASGQPYYAQLRSAPPNARRWRAPADAGSPGGPRSGATSGEATRGEAGERR